MESQDGEVAEKEYVELTVDFSKQTLKRIERAEGEQQLAVNLILDHNEIQKLDNLETYSNLKKLSMVNNQLFRMYGVSSLVHLTTLDISNNSLVIIEGLKTLTELKYLNLSKNRIKSIENLKSNLKLEKIDLSGNSIMCFSDISFLENLKELRLNDNRINHLTQCEKYLPSNLEVLALSSNFIADMNEISYLAQLASLKELNVLNNPFLNFSEEQKFNYRPFIKNWITSLIVLDDCPLDDIECLKAEWLYSQGRGRSFRIGEHAALIEYLNSVCPKEGMENAETEDVKKLKLILSKAQLHQQQLREQLSTVDTYRTSVTKKKVTAVPERMVTSFQDSPPKECRPAPELMTRSLDSGMMKKSSKILKGDLNQTPLQTSTTFIPIPDTLISPDVGHPVSSSYPGPCSVSSRTSRSSSRNSAYSTPESKRKSSNLYQRLSESSPVGAKKTGKLINSRSSTPLDMGSSPRKVLPSRNVTSPAKRVSSGSRTRERDSNHRETSEEEDSEVLALKIKAIQYRANQRKLSKMQQNDKTKGNAEEKQNHKDSKSKSLPKDLIDTKAWKAAVCIQRRWRGYRARNLNGEVLTGCKNIQMNRMQDYIAKVVSDMESTRIALEGNRKLVVLQMQAINSLWKKMAALQPSVASTSDESKVNLQNLVETCTTLNKQVEALQNMMKTRQEFSNSCSLVPIGTQTEIVAVHTPQDDCKEIFPYNPNLSSIGNSINSIENEGQLLGESLNSSEYSSATCSSKTVTELYTNRNVKGKSSDDGFSIARSVDDKDLSFFSENLTKPTIKLSENKEETPLAEPIEIGNSKEDAESNNNCSS